MGRPTNFNLGIWMNSMIHITGISGDIQAESSVWLFKSPLVGGGVGRAGTYCVGPTTGHTACLKEWYSGFLCSVCCNGITWPVGNCHAMRQWHACLQACIDLKTWSEWVGLTSPSTHYKSFRRRVFPVNHLHWYWQPNKNNQETEYKNNTKKNNAKSGPS